MSDGAPVISMTGTTLNGLALLCRLAASESTGSISPGDLLTFAGAAREVLAARGGLSFEAAIGIGVDGSRRTWPGVMRSHQRDEFYCQYARRFGQPGFPLRAAAISDQLLKYLRRCWPRDRVRGMPQSYFGQPNELLFRICDLADGSPPVTAKQIRSILATHYPRTEILAMPDPLSNFPIKSAIQRISQKETGE